MTPTKLEITDRGARALATQEVYVDVRDGLAQGLRLRVFATGRKTWYVDYRMPDGRRRTYKLGRYPGTGVKDARTLAAKVRGQVAEGRDPQAERQAERRRRREAKTVAELAKKYLESYARKRKRPRSAREDELQLARYVLPAWGPRPIGEIARRDVKRLIEELASGKRAARGKPTTSAPLKLRALLSKMFGWAVEEELLPANPAAGVPLPVKPVSRQRVLSEDELAELWGDLEALGELAPLSASALRLMLWTGQRPGEVLGVQWRRDLAGGWWTIPASVSKNSKSHRVPLVPSALEELSRVMELTGDQVHVFANPGTPGRPLRSLKTAVGTIRYRRAQRVLAASGLAPAAIAARVPPEMVERYFPGQQDLPVEVAEAILEGARTLTPTVAQSTGIADPRRTIAVAIAEAAAGLERWTPHDLRRTVATHLTGGCRVPRLVVERLLNHAEVGVAQVYDRSSYDTEKRRALLKWERRLAAITSGEAPPKVVAMPSVSITRPIGLA